MRDDSEFSEFAETAVTRLRQTAFLLSRDWHLALFEALGHLPPRDRAIVVLRWTRVCSTTPIRLPQVLTPRSRRRCGAGASGTCTTGRPRVWSGSHRTPSAGAGSPPP